MKALLPLMIAVTVSVCVFAGDQIARNPNPQSQQLPLPQGGTSVDPPEPDRAAFMRGKLKMVQKIVEGLATDDFDLQQAGAMDLLKLSESATWKSLNDPFYRHYSRNFEVAVRGLLDAAKSENPEKATFAYMHVTVSCMACHQHVRSTKRVACR
ncbi:MAG: hypothetical protein Fues2KO_14080 [Fuerstiella sp.]